MISRAHRAGVSRATALAHPGPGDVREVRSESLFGFTVSRIARAKVKASNCRLEIREAEQTVLSTMPGRSDGISKILPCDRVGKLSTSPVLLQVFLG